MDIEDLQFEYYKYISPYNVLVVTNDGELISVMFRFKVKAKVNFPEIRKGDSRWVQKVQLTTEKQDVFIISNSAYQVKYFQIIL